MPKVIVELWRKPLTRALAALILVFVIGLIFSADGAFYKWGTHRDMLRSVSVYGILACGMTLVIITGGIDLSVGSVLGFSAVLFSMLSLHYGVSPWLAMSATVFCGFLFGLMSGSFVSKFNVQPFIATLAVMVSVRGFAKMISGGEKVSTVVKKPDGSFENVQLPEIFDTLSSKVLSGNVAVVTIIFLVCVVFCWVLLSKLRWGRYFYAIGGNEEAAKLSGIPVSKIKLLAYGMSGLFGAVAGICQAAQELQGDPEAGVAYELNAIAIVVIGGTALNGGKGGIWLTFVGALTIGYLEKILSINAVGEATRLVLTGAIILIAVLFQRGK